MLDFTHKDAPHYELTRQGLAWQRGVAARYPAAIAKPRSVDEVIGAVTFASENDLTIGVRSGGHSWGSSFLADGGLVIDMSAMNALAINRQNKTAIAQPGVTNAAFQAGLGREGLAFPVGHCSEVALGGYLLAGGLGWNSRCWGPAAMSVSAIEVMTADGTSVRADDRRNQDLLWLARGAGSGFPGVVTSFELTLKDRPERVSMRELSFEIEKIRPVSEWLEHITETLPPWIEVEVKFTKRDGEGSGLITVTAVAFLPIGPTRDQGLEAFDTSGTVSPLHRSAPVEVDIAALHAHTDSYYVKDRYYRAEVFATGLRFGDLLRRSAELFSSVPSGESFFLAGNNPDSPEPIDAAFSLEGRSFLACYELERRPIQRAATGWLDGVVACLGAATVGRYVGEADLETGRWPASASFSAAAWPRVCALRRSLDPHGRFRAPPSWETTAVPR